jgi:sugar diacid utilization regulator
VTVEIPSGLPGLSFQPGDHICAIYRGSAGRDEALLPFLRAGLEAGDLCTAVLDQVDADDLLAELAADSDALDGDALAVLNSTEAYLREGYFDKERMIEFWEDSIGRGLADGRHIFARSCGEMTWSLREVSGVESLVEYECELNRFLPRYPQVIMCLYDLDLFDGQLVVDLLRTHPKLLLCGSLLDNPYYMEPEEFLATHCGRVLIPMARIPMASTDRPDRDQLSRLNALLVLSMLMTESSDETQILRMGASAAPSFADCRLVGVLLDDAPAPRWIPGNDDAPPPQGLDSVPSAGGPIEVVGADRAWAYTLGTGSPQIGHMVVAAERDLTPEEQFLLRVLAQQIGSAVRNSRLHRIERDAAVELSQVNEQLGHTVEALRQHIEIHHRLTRAAMSGEGMEGIAGAVHEVTGFPVAIEDRYGNLRAWAGPDQPDEYPKDASAQRELFVRRLLGEVRPVREVGRVLIAACPRADSIAVMALIDPQGAARDSDLVALEYGATILSMELARQRSVADTEIRIRRDLVEDLLSGTDADSALPRGEVFGRDLSQPHRVVVFEGRGIAPDEDRFFTAVRRACRDHALGQLLVSRAGGVVVLTDKNPNWSQLHDAILADLGGGQCHIGVGGRTHDVGDFPRSYREATLALRLQRNTPSAPCVTVFDDLGIYRLLATAEDTREIEAFVEEWLGPLIEYDLHRHSNLVDTLHRYLESGGHYDATSAALIIHRSTLKYRLQRIRQVSGRELGDPEVSFNLRLACRAWKTLQGLKGNA